MNNSAKILWVLFTLFFSTSVFAKNHLKKERPLSLKKLWELSVRPQLLGTSAPPQIPQDPGETLGQFTISAASYYQASNMLFVLAAYRSPHEEWRDDVETGAKLITSHLMSLHVLRGMTETHQIDDYFVNLSLSGNADRKVFAFPIPGTPKNRYAWTTVVPKQLNAYLSLVLWEKIRANPKKAARDAWVLSTLDYLVKDVIYPMSVDADGQHNGAPFPNYFDLIEAKLSQPLPASLNTFSWHSAIDQADWWIFFTAANLKSILAEQKLDRRYEKSRIDPIDHLLTLAKFSFDQRLANNNDFEYDVGRWADNFAYRYSGNTGSEYPESLPAQIDPEASWNVHFFDRMPWLLAALENGDTKNARYYKRLQTRLARQFANQVLYTTEHGPLTRNYMNGNDAWYNVGGGFGYAPSQKSYHFINGAWALLADKEPRIRDAYLKLLKVVRSHEPAKVAFRIRYYGKILFNVDNHGLQGMIDEVGPNSLAEARLRLIHRMMRHDKFELFE